MQNKAIEVAAPEWASRLLKVREVATIVGENPSTIYRKVDAGIYPSLIHIGSSSRMPGWDLWELVKRLMVERIEPEEAT
jgi:predicted DNA-binding transcriptional regulator AlpA